MSLNRLCKITRKPFYFYSAADLICNYKYPSCFLFDLVVVDHSCTLNQQNFLFVSSLLPQKLTNYSSLLFFSSLSHFSRVSQMDYSKRQSLNWVLNIDFNSFGQPWENHWKANNTNQSWTYLKSLSPWEL